MGYARPSVLVLAGFLLVVPLASAPQQNERAIAQALADRLSGTYLTRSGDRLRRR